MDLTTHHPYAVPHSDALRIRRQRLNLSLRELARRADCTHSFLAQVERGEKRRLSPELAFRLLLALEADQETWSSFFEFHGIAPRRFQRVA